ncbi:MAG: tetratricopeptide repeat protein, partial [Acidobacteria bacterium]|nr:tetratricopeptide repeat protein [Acidobacteriota bacterium]MCA1651516.1 tetratricopeptide repeat protein [Acidobacteriota bacterium]
IAPSSSVIALREKMAEHRAYLATAGVCFVVAFGVQRWGTVRERTNRAWFAYRLVVGGAIGVLALLTVARNNIWSSPVTLWREATVRAAGMWEPHYALADVLREAKDCATAVPEYEAVIRYRPMDRNAHTNLGICLAEIGRFEEAEAAFRRTLAIDPNFVRGYTNLGALALVRGDVASARTAYQEAIEHDPRNVLARMQLARILETRFRDYHGAARMCGEARALAPTTPGAGDCVERNRKLAASADAGS